MSNKMDARMVQKRSSVAGVVPTVPASNDHCDGTWIATDIYASELYYNEADNILYTRDDTGIVVIGGRQSYVTTANIPNGGGGVTIQVPIAYKGTVQDVSVWSANILLNVTVIRGNDGTYETVTLIAGKAYTGAEINITLK